MPGDRLRDKVAIITGGTSGIGRATACRFAEEGARVVVASPDSEAGRSTVDAIGHAGGEAMFLPTDVTNPQQVAALIAASMEAHGRLDVIFSNAGCNENGTAQETSIDSWARVLAVNLSAHFYVAKHGIPALAASGGGSMILTASELGLVGSARSVSYCAAKGGVVNLTRALAIDAAKDHVRVNCLAPGPTRTPLMEEWLGDDEHRVDRERTQIEPVLLKRMAEPDEIAAAVLFLASQESSFTTGSVHVVDGGLTSWYGM